MDISLQAALQEVVTGVCDPDNHFFICAHYYETEGKRIYMAAIYLLQSATWNIELKEDSLCCDVLLSRSHPDKHFTISVPYELIWSVQRNSHPMFTNEDIIYFNKQVYDDFQLPSSSNNKL